MRPTSRGAAVDSANRHLGSSATGGDGKTAGYRSLIEHWNGAVWKIVPSPNPKAALNGVLYGVTALSPRNAWAVGISQSGSRRSGRSLLHWNGKVWKLRAEPRTPPLRVGYSRLAHRRHCRLSGETGGAVGYFNNRASTGGQSRFTLALALERQVRGSACPSPSPGGVGRGVCALGRGGATRRVASGRWGRYDGSSGQSLLVERWTGTAWGRPCRRPGRRMSSKDLLSVSPLAARRRLGSGLLLRRGLRRAVAPAALGRRRVERRSHAGSRPREPPRRDRRRLAERRLGRRLGLSTLAGCRYAHPRWQGRSESSSQSRGSTGTTAAPRSSRARSATPAWRSSTRASTRRRSRSSRRRSRRTPTRSGSRSSPART